MRVSIRVQSGGCVRGDGRGGYVGGDGHVARVVGILQITVSTMEFELVKWHVFTRLNINGFHDVIVLRAEKWFLIALKSQFMIVGTPM